jgi:hypothetical protein
LKNDMIFKRRRGRPRWSGERVSKCDVRLNAEERNMLEELAERNEVSNSDVMRMALRDLYKFNSVKEK